MFLALGHNLGLQRLDDVENGFLKNESEVDDAYGANGFEPHLRLDTGARRSIRRDADEQKCPIGFGELQKADMAGMQNVEIAVDEDERAVGLQAGFQDLTKFLQGSHDQISDIAVGPDSFHANIAPANVRK